LIDFFEFLGLLIENFNNYPSEYISENFGAKIGVFTMKFYSNIVAAEHKWKFRPTKFSNFKIH